MKIQICLSDTKRGIAKRAVSLSTSIDLDGAARYLDHESIEIERVANSLFRDFVFEKHQSEKDSVLVREYKLNFRNLPFLIRFTLVSDVGMWGKSGTIEKQSWIFMPPDSKNSKRASAVYVPSPKSGEVYAQSSYSGTDNKSVQVAKSYLSEVHKKIAGALKNSKFMSADVQNRFGSDVRSRVFSALNK